MSRLRNFARGLASSYVAMAANIVFTLASVRLALDYLSEETFALWALITQITGYLALIDLGIGVSIARILADHKDERDGGEYGGVLRMGQVAFTIQAALMAAASLLLAPWFARWFGVEQSSQEEFAIVLSGQGLLLAALFLGKIVGVPFWSFQRYDVTHYSASAGLLANLGVMWLCFEAGWGLRSLLAGQAVATLIVIGWSWVAVIRLKLLPRSGAWGRLESARFRELIVFARDIFLMTLGSQLLQATQVIIVSRTLGLRAAAVWIICSKAFTLAQQAVARLYDTSAGGFAEMIVRGERDHLFHRFRHVVTVTASLSVAVGCVTMATNESFVAVWSEGKVRWSFVNDFLLAAFTVVFSVARCHTGLVAMTKDIRAMRFVYFGEGLTFLLLALIGTRTFGLPWVTLSALVAVTAWSGVFGLKRSRQYFGCSTSELLSWLIPSVRLALLSVPPCLALWWCFRDWAPLTRLVATGASTGAATFPLLWWQGLPTEVQSEIRSRLAKRYNRLRERS